MKSHAECNYSLGRTWIFGLVLVVLAMAAVAAVSAQEAEIPPPLPGVFTPAEEAYLNNHLGHLTYMVYYNEASRLDPMTAKITISQANRYLIEKMGLTVIDLTQIEKNKVDQRAAWEHETKGTVSQIHYIAQKFNADVYVEIDLGSDPKNPEGIMKIYEVSTATLLGSIAYHYQNQDLANAVWAIMPKLTDQTKALMKNSLQRGIRYEVIIQNTPNSRQLANMRRAMSKIVREVEQSSYSAGETILHVYTFQGRDKVEDAVYDAADAANMPEIYLVYARGKSFVFNSGL
jgi:hypothetical protein